MFTGIIEETGIVTYIKKLSSGISINISCKKILEDINLGDSICIDGVCTTVTRYDEKSFDVEISQETLNITTFKELKENDIVNLERALTPSTRMGGHIVLGHIDCTGKILSIKQLSDFYEIAFSIPEEIKKYVVYKGSITINGISLTIAKIENNIFNVAIIPHTFTNTNLKYLKSGNYVNIETDILARYIEKLLLLNNNGDSRINLDFLKENGFM